MLESAPLSICALCCLTPWSCQPTLQTLLMDHREQPVLLLPSPAQQNSAEFLHSAAVDLIASHTPTLQGVDPSLSATGFHMGKSCLTLSILPSQLTPFGSSSLNFLSSRFPWGHLYGGGCGTEGHGLVVGLGVLGLLVDSILKAFSNRKVSMIPAGTCSKRIPVTIHRHFPKIAIFMGIKRAMLFLSTYCQFFSLL